MRISLLASNVALAEYFVEALELAGHAVTLYHSRKSLFFALFTDVSLRQRAPYDLLLTELAWSCVTSSPSIYHLFLESLPKIILSELYTISPCNDIISAWPFRVTITKRVIHLGNSLEDARFFYSCHIINS
jgi:hypothetical protein